jgi:hypothetical protein
MQHEYLVLLSLKASKTSSCACGLKLSKAVNVIDPGPAYLLSATRRLVYDCEKGAISGATLEMRSA